MDKKAVNLRSELFEKYFENQDGVLLFELMEKLKYIINIWKELHNILETNSEDINKYTRIELIERINHNNKEYLIIKFMPWSYLVIDLNNNKVLSTEEIEDNFTEEFFVHNFNEKYINEGTNKISLYWFYTFNGKIDTLINFYIENIELFNLAKNISYKLFIEEAWTYLSINITNGNIQLGFQSEDQLLYERLFLNSDLTPFGLQDATSKIGKDKMKEMFNRIKDIIIPFDIIPQELLNFINSYDDIKLSLNKQKKD